MRVELVEEGAWVMPSWGRSEDDEEWHNHGWKVTTYSGERLFIDADKSKAIEWLAENGYQGTGDGSHYQSGEEYYCGICGCMMPISHFPH